MSEELVAFSGGGGEGVLSYHLIFHLSLTHRTARIGRRDVIKEKDTRKKLERVLASGASATSIRRRSSSGAGAGGGEETDQYGLSQLFQPDNAPKDEGAGREAEDTAVRTKFKVQMHGTFPIVT